MSNIFLIPISNPASFTGIIMYDSDASLRVSLLTPKLGGLAVLYMYSKGGCFNARLLKLLHFFIRLCHLKWLYNKIFPAISRAHCMCVESSE